MCLTLPEACVSADRTGTSSCRCRRFSHVNGHWVLQDYVGPSSADPVGQWTFAQLDPVGQLWDRLEDGCWETGDVDRVMSSVRSIIVRQVLRS
jgi:hypothetical protein